MFGCEPNPATHAHLEPSFPGPLHPVAITGFPGPRMLHTFPPGSHPNQLGSSCLFALPEATSPRVSVECITLDEFVADVSNQMASCYGWMSKGRKQTPPQRSRTPGF